MPVEPAFAPPVTAPQTWVIVSALVMLGLGVMSAVAHTKRRDPPSETPGP